MKKFEKATMANPAEFKQEKKEIKDLLNFLDGKLVAFYSTGTFHGYFENLTVAGMLRRDPENTRVKFDILSSARDLKDLVDDSLLSFSAGSGCSYEYQRELEAVGYIVEKRGRSGFASRNSYHILPNPDGQKKVVHIIKEGDVINGKKISDPKHTIEKRIWYCGTEEMSISDPQKIKEIMKVAEKKAAEWEEKKFLDFWQKQSGGESTAIIKTGGDEPISYIPPRFKKLAEIKIVNTADHRRNRFHTYEGVYLDTEVIKEKNFITIKVPDCYKGLVIGRGGKNINALSKELGCFLKII